MEADETFVYPGSSYFTCGSCGYSLAPFAPERRPFRLRVSCGNVSCSMYRKVLLIGDEHRVTAFDTGELAPDPRLHVGTGLDTGGGQAQATNATTEAGPTPLPTGFTTFRL
jgi:hypothetical protein